MTAAAATRTRRRTERARALAHLQRADPVIAALMRPYRTLATGYLFASAFEL